MRRSGLACEVPTHPIEPHATGDDHVRERIEEAYADPTGARPIDIAAIKAELSRRLEAISNAGSRSMGRVDRFRQAEQDLLLIGEYIAQENPAAVFGGSTKSRNSPSYSLSNRLWARRSNTLDHACADLHMACMYFSMSLTIPG